MGGWETSFCGWRVAGLITRLTPCSTMTTTCKYAVKAIKFACLVEISCESSSLHFHCRTTWVPADMAGCSGLFWLWAEKLLYRASSFPPLPPTHHFTCKQKEFSFYFRCWELVLNFRFTLSITEIMCVYQVCWFIILGVDRKNRSALLRNTRIRRRRSPYGVGWAFSSADDVGRTLIVQICRSVLQQPVFLRMSQSVKANFQIFEA